MTKLVYQDDKYIWASHFRPRYYASNAWHLFNRTILLRVKEEWEGKKVETFGTCSPSSRKWMTNRLKKLFTGRCLFFLAWLPQLVQSVQTANWVWPSGQSSMDCLPRGYYCTFFFAILGLKNGVVVLWPVCEWAFGLLNQFHTGESFVWTVNIEQLVIQLPISAYIVYIPHSFNTRLYFGAFVTIGWYVQKCRYGCVIE